MSYISTRAVAAITILLLSSSRAFSDTTLCSTSEEIVFSCPTGKEKIVSVCAHANEKGGGIVSYRFGTPIKNDLELMANTSDFTPSIDYRDNLWSRAYNYAVRFKQRNYLYEVQQRWDGCPRSSNAEDCSEDSFFAGVVVYKSGKQVARLTCGVRHSIDVNVLEKYNVPRQKDVE